MLLGDLLVANGFMTQEQLESALHYQKNIGGRLGAILVKLGFVSEDKLINFLAEHENLRLVSFSPKDVPEEIVRLFPQELVERLEAVPIEKESGTLTVAMGDPTDFNEIDELRLHTNLKVEPVLAAPSQIRSLISRVFHIKVADEPQAAAKPVSHRHDKRYGMTELVSDLQRDAGIKNREEMKKAQVSGKAKDEPSARFLVLSLAAALLEKKLVTEADLANSLASILRRNGVLPGGGEA